MKKKLCLLDLQKHKLKSKKGNGRLAMVGNSYDIVDDKIIWTKNNAPYMFVDQYILHIAISEMQSLVNWIKNNK